ncbi:MULTISPECIES: TadE family protein [Microbacterium]|uniref:TadE family protein n=2 Tax=Actinomycetes TaxID=1760 RepID=A0ABY4IIJ8_9MICO|nr:TadE family protein [Microbacterium sufflavum]UPL12587.1 TadE family protein [Microbacterium sufflavum]
MRDDRGSSSLEFIAAGVLMLVPLLYLVIVLGSVQEQTLGVEAAARHAARVIATAPDARTAASQGDAVLSSIASQYGIDDDDVQLAVTCLPQGVPCPSAGATVTVSVATSARLPFVPAVLGLDRATSVPIEAVSAQKVSRQWGAE